MSRISVENFVLNFLSVWEKIIFFVVVRFFSRTLYIRKSAESDMVGMRSAQAVCSTLRDQCVNTHAAELDETV